MDAEPGVIEMPFCAVHAERTVDIADLKTCIRQTEARLASIDARLAVGDRTFADVARDLNALHSAIREQRAEFLSAMEKLAEQISVFSDCAHSSAANGKRLETQDGDLRRIETRLAEIEKIAAKRQGIDERVDGHGARIANLETMAAELRASVRAINKTVAVFGGLITFGLSVLAILIRMR